MSWDKFSCAGFYIVDSTFQFVLLGESEAGYLSPQKGGVETKQDSSLFECACRETREESGIDARTELEFAADVHFIENAPSGRPNIMYWLAKLKLPKTTFLFDPNELKSVKWYHIETLLTLQSPKLKAVRLDILQAMFTTHISKPDTKKWITYENLQMDKWLLSEHTPQTEPNTVNVVPKNKYTNESQYFVQVLRHELKDLVHDARGYVSVDALLSLIAKRKQMGQKAASKLKPLTFDIVNAIVTYDNTHDKQRLNLLFDKTSQKWNICANQGHSSGRTEYTPILTPYPFLVHGTERRFEASIRAKGLQKMGRTHIHCIAQDPATLDSTKITSGFKNASDCLVVINMEATMRDGLKWFLSENDVCLTEGPIEPRYLSFIDMPKLLPKK